MKNDFVKVFIGSDIEANYIASLLIENQIQCIVQNQLERSLSACWVNGSAYNSSINEYLKSKNI